PPQRNHRRRNHTDSQRSASSHIMVAGGLWNCQSAVQKADYLSALASLHFLHFLAPTETWITPENSATLAALSSAFLFTHSPRCLGKVSFPTNLHVIVIYRPPGSLDHFIDELDILLTQFPIEGNPLILLGDFNLSSDKLHSSCILLLFTAFDLTLNHSPPTHKAGNVLDLIFTHFQLLTSSNPTTCPLDPIPATLFQTIARDLLPFISVIVNTSLSSGCVPTAFKTARVVPILKKATLDSSSVPTKDQYHFSLSSQKPLNKQFIINCLFFLLRTSCMIPISLQTGTFYRNGPHSNSSFVTYEGLDPFFHRKLPRMQKHDWSSIFRSSHITPLLRSLHWLPVAACIRFKTLMLDYKAKNGPAPSYMR
ncbi:hypothetical protein P4O66_009508, partial [Electrophorus voltai]